MMPSRSGVLVASTTFLVAGAWAQISPAPDTPLSRSHPVFRADTNLVICSATVLTDKRRPVLDLPQKAFTILDDGAPQEIRVFAHDDAPVSLGLVVDSSAEMIDKRARVAAAALSIARESNPQDEVFVVNFNDEAFLDLPKGEEFTSDPSEIKTALSRINAQGNSSIRDAIVKSIAHLGKAHRQSKALVVITNGKDTSSLTSEEQLLKTAESSDAAIYIVGLLNKAACGEHLGEIRFNLRRLANRTGGAAFFPKDVSEMDAIAHEIAHRLRNQYVFGYRPPNNAVADGQFRSIQLVVNGHKKWIVQTRAGYRAASEQPIAPSTE